MDLQEKLIERLFEQYGQKGKNLQTVLDNSFFRDLPLSEKVRLIEKHKGDLSKDPRFNWSAVGKGAITGGIGATSSVLLKQILMHGGHDFKPHVPGLAVAGILGAAVGAAIQNRTSKEEYQRDMTTKRNVDDAINVLINRSMGRVPVRENMLEDLRYRVRRLPEEMGGLASQWDWSVPPAHGDESKE